MKHLYIYLVFLTLAFFWMEGCSHKEKKIYGSEISTAKADIEQGKELFNESCTSCHNFVNDGIGPNLSGLTRTVKTEWIKKFIKTPGEMLSGNDERSKELFEEYKTYMPGFSHLTDEEINNLLSYMHTFVEIPDKSGHNNNIENPIAEKTPSSGITAELELVVQIPASNEKPPLARINKMDCESSSGRLFINDMRGILYEMNNDRVDEYFNIADFKKAFIHEPGLGTGFGSFAFHPDFSTNGLFYTTHTEPGGSATADFALPDTVEAGLQWVISEWKAENPTDIIFKGTSREILRIDFVSTIHGMQEIAFQPNINQDDPDYGLLFIGSGDGGSVQNGYPEVADHKGSGVWCSIMRIDPAGSNSDNGAYGIPPDNPFINTNDVVGELYAWGFRNPNRLVWDTAGRLLASDIGQAHIEEVNLVESGKFYGWPVREGTFLLNPVGNLSHLFPLPGNESEWEVTYPIIQYDHDDGVAISGGFVAKTGPFKGNYVFGDIPTGHLYFSDLEGNMKTWEASINGEPISLKEIVDSNRVDLRFGMDCYDKLYLFTKADGKVYRIGGE